jgi:hypothetical protein
LIFNISGILDLANLKDLDRQIRAFVNEPMVKRDGQDLEWTLKRLRQENSNGTSELKYLLRKEDGLHPSSDKEGAIFSLERRIKF